MRSALVNILDAWAVPVERRHWLQWQRWNSSKGPLTWNCTRPQRQAPFIGLLTLLTSYLLACDQSPNHVIEMPFMHIGIGKADELLLVPAEIASRQANDFVLLD